MISSEAIAKYFVHSRMYSETCSSGLDSILDSSGTESKIEIYYPDFVLMVRLIRPSNFEFPGLI